MSDTLSIQYNQAAMLSGPTRLLRPLWALEFGLAQGLVFGQLVFRANTSGLQHEGRPAFRSSYTKLQRHQFPFFSRRWIIKIIKRLDSVGAIEVVHTKRVNLIAYNEDYKVKVKQTAQTDAAMLVFPALACTVGLKEAIVLQQIHLRHYSYDGHYWVIRSLSNWHAEAFMFIGMATVQRVFARLRQRELIFVRSYERLDHMALLALPMAAPNDIGAIECRTLLFHPASTAERPLLTRHACRSDSTAVTYACA